MKIKRLISILVFSVPIPLAIASSFFIKQSIDYKSANRKLILQNDSLKSVLIELNHKVKETENASLAFPKRVPK
jgi:hypothetical protein